MPINTLEYSTIFQKALDRQMVQGATTGWMEANESKVEYRGGNQVTIKTLDLDGLANYDRDNGYVQGALTMGEYTLTMGQDRGRKFQIDVNDNDETGFIASVANAMGEFQKKYVIPEIDAYRYSKLASYAIANGRSETTALTGGNALTQLLADFTTLEDQVTGFDPIVIMSPITLALLSQDTRFNSFTSESVLKQGSLDITLKAVDSHPIVKVQSRLLKTAFIFNDGETEGQEEGGFTDEPTAQAINWLIVNRDVPIAISKTDTVRIFDPMTFQKANAWGFDYRKYHELWVKNSDMGNLWANLAPAA